MKTTTTKPNLTQLNPTQSNPTKANPTQSFPTTTTPYPSNWNNGNANDPNVQLCFNFIQSFNNNDPNGFRQTLAPKATYNEVATQQVVTGPNQIIECWQGWRQSMPNIQGTVQNCWSNGTTVTMEVTWNGTQTGKFETPDGTFAPSGKNQTTSACIVFEVKNNTITSCRHYFDMLFFMQQIGALPEPAFA